MLHSFAMTPLQRLVTDRMLDLNLTLRGAAIRSDGLISHSAINFIKLGHTDPDNIRPRTAKGLALALDLPLSQVQEAIRASGGRPAEQFELPARANKLTPKQRKAVLAYIDALLE